MRLTVSKDAINLGDFALICILVSFCFQVDYYANLCKRLCSKKMTPGSATEIAL